ncbi:hypothetical protein NKDENANG_04151 [Candidatus Entotheonellaceae bacterium PAL068K]
MDANGHPTPAGTVRFIIRPTPNPSGASLDPMFDVTDANGRVEVIYSAGP